MFCCTQRSHSSRWELYQAHQLGIADMLLPTGHMAKITDDGILAGRTLRPTGTFSIRPLFNAKHVAAELTRFDMLLPTENLHQRLQIDLGLPKDRYRACSLVKLNFMDSDPGRSAKASHQIALKGPAGNGLSMEYVFPYSSAEEIIDVVSTMVKSVKWADVDALCKSPASNKLLGSWATTTSSPFKPDEYEMLGIIPGEDESRRAFAKKTLHFDPDSRFSFTHLIHRRPRESAKLDLESDDGDEMHGVGLRYGTFSVFEVAKGKLVLLLLDDEYVHDVTLVEGIKFSHEKFVKAGEEWTSYEP